MYSMQAFGLKLAQLLHILHATSYLPIHLATCGSLPTKRLNSAEQCLLLVNQD